MWYRTCVQCLHWYYIALFSKLNWSHKWCNCYSPPDSYILTQFPWQMHYQGVLTPQGAGRAWKVLTPTAFGRLKALFLFCLTLGCWMLLEGWFRGLPLEGALLPVSAGSPVPAAWHTQGVCPGVFLTDGPLWAWCFHDEITVISGRWQCNLQNTMNLFEGSVMKLSLTSWHKLQMWVTSGCKCVPCPVHHIGCF